MSARLTNRFLSVIGTLTCICILQTAADAGELGKKRPEPGVEPAWKTLADGQGVAVVVSQKKPLKRKHTKIEDGQGYYWLQGVIEVELQNMSGEEVVLEDFEVHNLVFVDVKSGLSFILFHSCACAAQCDARSEAATWSRKALRLRPGERKVLTFEDFGCSGSMYVPPPAGEYDLYYRIRPYVDKLEGLKCEKPDSIKDVLDSCRSLLDSIEFWRGAWTGIPVRVKLKK